MNCAWPKTSVFGSHRICPLPIMFMASYPAIVLRAPSTDRNHWLAITRFFTKRWSCSTMLVQIRCSPASAILAQLAGLLELINGGGVRWMAIHVDPLENEYNYSLNLSNNPLSVPSPKGAF